MTRQHVPMCSLPPPSRSNLLLIAYCSSSSNSPSASHMYTATTSTPLTSPLSPSAPDSIPTLLPPCIPSSSLIAIPSISCRSLHPSPSRCTTQRSDHLQPLSRSLIPCSPCSLCTNCSAARCPL